MLVSRVDLGGRDSPPGRLADREEPVGRRHAAISCAQLVGATGRRSSVRPQRSVSSERMAFWSASLNVRPMAITSPTDFICVVSVRSASGNFSNAKRGILTTSSRWPARSEAGVSG